MHVPLHTSAVVVAAAAAALAVSTAEPSALAACVHLAALTAAAAVFAGRWRRVTGAAGRPWGLLALAALLATTSALAEDAQRLVAGLRADSAESFALDLAARVPLVAALALTVRATGPRTRRAALPEGALGGLLAAAVAFAALSAWGSGTPGMETSARLAVAAVVVAAACAQGLACRARGPWAWAAAGALLLAVADVLEGVPGDGRAATAAAAVETLAFGVAAAAALTGARRTEDDADVWPLGRLAVLAGALAGAPALVAVADDAPARAVALAAGALALVRTGALVLRLERLRSDSHEAQNRLEHLATHDELSGLPNRRLLVDRLQNALLRAPRQRRFVAVLFLDLDHFKEVNDIHGHRAGDAVLQETARRLIAAVRDGDTVSRLGGDEFVVVCPDVPGAYEAVTVAERILGRITEPYLVGDVELELATSIGVALSDGRVRADELIRDADHALYEAKQSGRGRYCVYDEAMRAQVSERRERERLVRRALEAGDIHLHYSPEISLETGGTERLRAALQFAVPGGHTAAGDEVTAIAESVGLGARLAERVLCEACTAAVNWNRLPLPSGDVGVVVTLSPRQFANGALPAAVTAALETSGLAPGLLTLRVDEELLLADPELAAARFAALADAGVHISVTGPGAGKASLRFIAGFRADGVVVPAAMLAGLGVDREATAQMAGLVLLARSHGFDVTADGVETEEQARTLAAVGCPHARGPYAGPPVPADAAAARMVAGLRPELRAVAR